MNSRIDPAQPRHEPAGRRAPTDRDLSVIRASYLARQAELESAGRNELAAAYRRLGTLTEVWECLRDSSPVAAAELAAFCEETNARLQASDEAEADRVSQWALTESATHWGEYLGLIEPGESPAPPAPPTPPARKGPDGQNRGEPDGADDPSTIDAATLFRMLTGTPKEKESPAVDRRARGKSGVELNPSSSLLRGPVTKSGPPRTPPPSPEPPPAPVAAPARPATPSPATPARVPLIKLPDIDPELRDCFLSESADLFERIEGLVLDLGRKGADGKGLHELGRCLHTLKGAAGSVELTQVVFHLHEVEGAIEASGGVVSEGLVEALHGTLRFLDAVFQAMRTGGSGGGLVDEPPPAPAPAPSVVTAPAPPPTAAPPVVPVATVAAPVIATTTQAPPQPAAPARPAPTPTEPSREAGPASEGPVRVPAERIDELMDLVSELITRRGLWAAQSESMKDFSATARTLRGRIVATIDRIRDLQPEGRSRGLGPREHHLDLDGLLRRLAEQTDDLAFLAESARAAAKPLSDSSDLLARQTLQLWEALQSIRIVPVKGLFQRLTRVAQDAARFEGRQVEVATVGDETGLDRAVQDKAFEPLLHIVRNAVCHGIEPPEERVNAGKPAAGTVTLEASRAGNTLVLTVRDDGKGLDYEAIAAKGRRLGLIGPDDHPGVERLNALVFQSGFSTRDSANAIAGRGVGMDVVAQEVARLHGSVSLSSTRGQGTRLSLALPARLALEQVMIFRVRGQAFALPMDLIERAEPYDAAGVVGEPPDTRLKLGGDEPPLIAARQVLGLGGGGGPCPMVLMVRAEGEPLALLVDGIEGTRELVIKPLATLLSGHPVVSGVGHSTGGEVVFTLSPVGLSRWRREARTAGDPAPVPDPGRPAPLLVVDDSLSVRTVAARLLRGFGYAVEEAADGLEALSRIRAGTYGLVLTDLEMPRMDGFELIAELVRLGITPNLPVLMASTRDDLETRRKAAVLGASGFLGKPIDPEELETRVRALTRREPAPPRAAGPGGEPRRQGAPRPAVL